ncbi:MAG: sulfatase family protein [Acidimicrobiales bacterium]
MSSHDDAPRRPNILVVITDQQRADHAGFAGNDVVRTPHLDALAARGTVFDNAWVANPVCMPNRSTLMTGRMPTAHGVVFNDRSLEWGANTFVRAFRSAGWRTALIGKSHLQHGMSRNAVFPVGEHPAATDAWPDGWDNVEDAERYHADLPPDPDDFYGFDRIELSIDHGAVISGHHLQWALDKGGRFEDLVVPYSPESPAARRSEHYWQVFQPAYGPELHSTTFVTERTIDFIEEAHGQGEPWLAWASFPDPHHPMTPPGDWFDRHDPADMEVPASIDDPLDHAPRYLRHIQGVDPNTTRSWVGMCGAGNPDIVRSAIAGTYGAIEMIDDGVGQIMATIERLGATDDTIVVFTSDHGDMMGEHGLLLKGFMHYRGTLQVPLVITDPQRPAGASSSLVGSIDLAQTLLDLGGLEGHVGMQGHSLVPLLDDPTETVRDSLLIEDDAPSGLAKLARLPAKTRTLIAEDSDGGVRKYTRHSTGEDQLFDLTADPTEVDELGHRDRGARGEMLERLADALMAADDEARGAPVGSTAH